MDFFEKLFLKNHVYFDVMPVKVKDIAVWLQPTDKKQLWKKALATLIFDVAKAFSQ
jgi:hypothetical protein